ncbi:MAG: PAS domain S-box protein [Oligoflexia bacterium]|nr:PAS domain S-box protein [Oligoflexia bacterium]
MREREIIDAIPLPAAILDAELRVIAANDAWSSGPSLGPEELGDLHAELERCFEGRLTRMGELTRFSKGAGKRTWYRWSARAWAPDRLTLILDGITPCKEREAALRRDQERLRKVLEAEPECVKLVSPEGILLEMNPAGLAMIESDVNEAIGSSIYGSVAPEDRDAFRKLTEEVCQGASGSLEFEVIGRRGTRRWLETHAVPFRPSEDSRTVLLAIARDISERKRAEREASRARERLELALKASGVGIWDWDVGQDRIYWSEEVYRVFGRPKGEFAANFDAFIEAVHPEDRELVSEAVTRALQDESDYSIEFRILWPDGSTHWVFTQGRSVRGEERARARRLLGTVSNIDERKRIETTLASELESKSVLWASILEAASYPIISTDQRGMVLSYNPAAEELLGYSREEVVGRTSFALWHDPKELRARGIFTSGAADESSFLTLLRGTHSPGGDEWTFISKQGRRIPVSLSVSTLRTREGMLLGYLGVVSDLSERKKAEQRLQETLNSLERRVEERTAELQRAIHYRDEFLSIASHELKTPLTPLLLQAQAFRHRIDRGAADAELVVLLRRTLPQAERQVLRLAHLVDNLLDVSRISSGSLVLQKSEVDLPELLRNIASQYEATAHAAGSRVDLELEPGLVCEADSFRIEQVVVNLLVNAFKYAPGTPVLLRLRRDGSRARIEVSDQGPGVSAADRNRIFDRYERGMSGSWITAGLGLGLYISKQIVEAHGGTLALESPVKGASFVITLPLAR